jgi:hypothetical protein
LIHTNANGGEPRCSPLICVFIPHLKEYLIFKKTAEITLTIVKRRCRTVYGGDLCIDKSVTAENVRDALPVIYGRSSDLLPTIARSFGAQNFRITEPCGRLKT